MKSRRSSSTLKKVVVLLLDGSSLKGYLNPGALRPVQEIDLLTLDGEHQATEVKRVKCVCFVREFNSSSELERKTFLSRPKLDGLWVRLRFRDDDTLEGIVPNDLLDLLDSGIELTPPDLHGNVLRMFVPRGALVEMKVLGVVGAARRPPRPVRPPMAEAQSKLFDE